MRFLMTSIIYFLLFTLNIVIYTLHGPLSIINLWISGWIIGIWTALLIDKVMEEAKS